MELYKYPTVRVAPRIYSAENEAILEKILKMLIDEENEKLKTSDFVTFPIAYVLVINYYVEWDEEILETYWVNEFYEKYPDHTAAKLAYATCSIPSYKELNVDSLFGDEIELLFHEKNSNFKFYDEEYQSLLYFLCRHYVKKGDNAKAKELYRCALGIQNYSLVSDLAFIIRDREIENLSVLSEDEDIWTWASIFNEDLEEKTIPENPNSGVSYILLNKIPNLINQGEISEILEFQDKGKLRQDLYWVLRGGVTRVFQQGDKASYEFLFNVLYLAAHYQLYDVIKFVVVIVSEMPPDLFEEFAGDIGIEILSQPLSVLAAEQPEIITKIVTEVNFQHYYTALFFDILCYTYRISGKESVLKQIDLSWEFAFESQQELLGYFVGSIVDHEINGYKEKMEEAYAKEYINLRYFEKLEDQEPSLWMRKYDAPSLEGTTFESMLSAYKEATAKVQGKQVPNLDEHIDQMIEESLTASSAFTDQLESEELFYDENDFLMFDDDDPLNLHMERQDPVVRQDTKVGRNDPCPCGSGKKYKKCCLRMN